MTTPYIADWQSLDRVDRAEAVLEWCDHNGIHTGSIFEHSLAAAVTEWEQAIAQEPGGVPVEASPADYVNLIRVIAAFLRSRI